MDATLDDDIEEDDILYAGKAAEDEELDGIIEEEDEGAADEDLIYEDEDEEPDGEIDWDLALKDFPAEQDEVDLAPTPEEAERNAALKLVRATDLPEGVELEVEDAVEEVDTRPRTFKDQLAGLSVRGKRSAFQQQQVI